MDVHDDTAGRQPGDGHGLGRRSAAREVLWLLLVVATVGNAVASAAGAAVTVHLVLGLVTASCAGLLVAHRLRPSS